MFRYHGTEIRCAKDGHACALLMPDHPLDGRTFGVPRTVAPLVDLWMRERRLSDYTRTVPKPDGHSRR